MQNTLKALRDYCAAQLNGAQTAFAENCDDTAKAYMSDASDVMALAVAYMQHGSTETLLQEVDKLDTLVREDLYEYFEEYGVV